MEERTMTTQLDARTLKFIATLDPKARQAFADFSLAAKRKAAELGCDYIMICGNRTFAEQDRLYAQGRKDANGNKVPGPKVTNARGGYSSHNFGIAADYGVFRRGSYLDESEPLTAARVHKACAEMAEGFGLSAGAFWQSFPDLPHYEIATRLTLTQKRDRYKREGSVL